MRLPIDLGTTLLDPSRNFYILAAEIAEDLELSYGIAWEIIGFKHRRADARYNERIVKKQYKPGTLVFVQQHVHPYEVSSKLVP